MPTILPIQSTFDKAIPDNFGNAEYRAERQLLIAIDEIIDQCGLEDLVIAYFMDVASVNKYISVFGTGKSARLTGAERDNVRANAVCPRNPAQLRQRLEDDTFRNAQRRRSQTEARISILSHCFCGAPMKQKGFEHRQIHMGLSVLSHNLWVTGRLKIAQEKARQQAA